MIKSNIYTRLGWFGRGMVLFVAYCVILFVALLASFLLRFDFVVPEQYWSRFWGAVVWVVAGKLVLLGVFGQFRSLLTFFSIPDAKRVGAAMLLAGGGQIVVWYVVGGADMIPRGVIVTDLLVSFLLLCGFRLGLRFYRERVVREESSGEERLRRRKVAILGAGSAGAALFRDIQGRGGLGMEVVCFIDDDRSKIGQRLHGKPVLGPTRQLAKIAESLELKKAILAMPSARAASIRRIVGLLNDCGLDHDILPSVDQILHRRVTVEHLRHVSPEDLLGREPVRLDDEQIRHLLKGSVVAVTGAGGSIGSELCRQIASHGPLRLVLIERSEPALFAIQQELAREFEWVEVDACAASVCNGERINSIFQRHRPDIVFHAAAHKHVPLMESQPVEAILNNSIGTLLVAEAAMEGGCQKFVLVSTDKAVNPTNVMGASKRLAELIVSGVQNGGGGGTVLCSVRFGNVLGSSGSVLPIFRRQIAVGGPVTVTHPEVARYFMSIPEAVGLVLQSAALSSGGEVFVLDMGEPIRIQDLATQMIELCGLVPGEDIKIRFTGLRPGEKLYEEPIHRVEDITETAHPMIRRLVSNRRDERIVDAVKEIAASRIHDMGPDELKNWLVSHIPEYRVWKK